MCGALPCWFSWNVQSSLGQTASFWLSIFIFASLHRQRSMLCTNSLGVQVLFYVKLCVLFHFSLEHSLWRCCYGYTNSNAVCDRQFSSFVLRILFFFVVFNRIGNWCLIHHSIYTSIYLSIYPYPSIVLFARQTYLTILKAIFGFHHFTSRFFSRFLSLSQSIYGFVMAAKCTFIYCRCCVCVLCWWAFASYPVDIPYLMFFFVIYTFMPFSIFEFNFFPFSRSIYL